MSNYNLDLCAKPGYKMGLIKRIKWQLRQLKYMRQRAKRGFCDLDVWSFMDYHAELVSAMMAYLVGHNMSHPAEVTDEEWKEILMTISNNFAFWGRDLPCPAYEEYQKHTQRHKNSDGSITFYAPENLLERWRAEEQANYELKMKKLKEGFDLLYKWYPTLWD
jgi:hypothetical protein